jgi:redox-sensing transcriptional repressor
LQPFDIIIKKNKIDIAIFALPAIAVKEIVEDVIDAGIKGIWNFSHLDIDVPDSVALVNVHLSDSLMTLAYKINEKQNSKQ